MTAKQIILLVTQRKTELEAFIKAVELDSHVTLATASDTREALEAAARTTPALVVIDQMPGGDHALSLARQLMQVNAFIHTAIISDADDAEFHEQSEGLGVLMRLAAQPGGQEARELISRLREVTPS